MKDQLQLLLDKEMSRKEFLQHIGAAILIFFGISGLLKALTHQQTSTAQPRDMSYGSSAYGGGQ